MSNTSSNNYVQYLDMQQSKRLRDLMRNAADLHDLSIIDLQVAGAFSGDLSRSTIARIITDEASSRIDYRQAGACAEWLGKIARVSSEQVCNYVSEGGLPEMAICELTARKVFRQTTRQLAHLLAEVRRRFVHTVSLWILADTVPSAFLDESTFQKVLRHRIAGMSGSGQRFRVELEFHNNVPERLIHTPIESVLILTHVGLERFFDEHRNDALTPDERNRVVENLIDAVEINGLCLCVVDDRPGRAGSQIRPFLSSFEWRAVFDRQASLRLDRNTCARILYAAPDSATQAVIVDMDVHAIGLARHLAIAEWPVIRHFLLSFATQDCWLNLREREKDNL